MAESTAPYGSWQSKISSTTVVSESRSIMEVRIDPFQEDKVFWSEMRPEEEGRYVICCWSGGLESITPDGFSSRTLVHEYGGGAFFVHKYRIYFSNYEDQRMYCQKIKKSGTEPVPITPKHKAWRYADGAMYKKNIVVCVREDHEVLSEGAEEAQNTVVSINRKKKEQVVLVSGANFYSTPRVSKNGTMAWVQWNHPNMPWDDTELWLAEISSDGDSLKDDTKRKVAGGVGISVMLPKWSPDDKLLYIHDKTNWWNLYQLDDDDEETSLCPRKEEIGQPAWEFGGSPYSCNPTGNGDILMIHGSELACLKPSGEKQDIKIKEDDYKAFSKLEYSPDGKYAYMVAGGPQTFAKLIKLDLKSGKSSVIRESHGALDIDGYISVPQEVSWDTRDGAKAYGYYYPPQNKDYQGPDDETPPLLVKVHGGPTSACSPVLDLNKQFVTSRGFAVLDVNYRGSTGFGRKFRDALKANWGLIDVQDCCDGALYLAKEDKVDGKRLTIDGGSAGGFVALSALTFHKDFSAGTSNYGVSDISALAENTHKFESHYTETLVGPYPEDKATYEERSPVYHASECKAALAMFQGSEDKIVPPEQSEKMYDAVKDNGVPVAYKVFEGEQHGFRKAENIKFSIDGEFYFYSKVFNFDAPGIQVDLVIENLPEEES